MNHWEVIRHTMPPRENQQIAINEAVENLQEFGFHGLFCCMGLGKTKSSLNTAEVLATYKSLKRLVIICPKALTNVWREQIPEHSNFSFDPVIWNSQKAKTQKFTRRIGEMFTANFPIFIVNLEAFQTKNQVLTNLMKSICEEPTMIIMDESSKIKNIKAQRTKRILECTAGASYKMILTGTPVEESPLDVYSQFEFLRSNFWYKGGTASRNYFLFQARYAITKEITLSEGRRFKKVVGFRRVQEIADKIKPYITNQPDIKEWVDMPELVTQTIHADMSKEQTKLYTDMRDNLIAQHGDELITASSAVALLTRLRQIAGGFIPETGEAIGKDNPAISALLEDVSEYSGKVVIFASYVAEIEGIVKALQDVYGEQDVISYYGATKDRDTAVQRFRDTGKFFVVNPSVGGYGINIQCASLMYWYSRPFSYAQNVQGEARVYRAGQKNTTVIKDIVCKGTVQEQVVKAIKNKHDFVTEFTNMTLKDLL